MNYSKLVLLCRLTHKRCWSTNSLRTRTEVLAPGLASFPVQCPRNSASIFECAAVSRMNQHTIKVQAITPVTYQ